jgi:hypothetical protein
MLFPAGSLLAWLVLNRGFEALGCAVAVGEGRLSARVGVAVGFLAGVAVGTTDNDCDSGAEDGAANAAGCDCAAVGGALLGASRTKAMIATKTNVLSCRVFIFHHSSHAAERNKTAIVNARGRVKRQPFHFHAHGFSVETHIPGQRASFRLSLRNIQGELESAMGLPRTKKNLRL